MPLYRYLTRCLIIYIIVFSYILIIYPNIIDKSFANSFTKIRITRIEISTKANKNYSAKHHNSRLQTGYMPFNPKLRTTTINKSN